MGGDAVLNMAIIMARGGCRAFFFALIAAYGGTNLNLPLCPIRSGLYNFSHSGKII